MVSRSVVKIVSVVMGITVCRTAARRLVNKALQIRKEDAGSLLQSIRLVKGFEIEVKTVVKAVIGLTVAIHLTNLLREKLYPVMKMGGVS